ncbi:branched-chain amino acid ABC transporter permease [Salinibacterium sp. NK8237]|uniref:branched-chain amino acid ABC transporter permease n=1 Tax=Salinibacterium sp. NK8237 TaxID=2792038 RepID=UPI0018CD104F|nr:branched-chain amino acid ABC transporter permease [Salinibacterium sp. NK8237]MBH0130640.1 branched-chain amino acid ABC transporter permease [Salinibacterium sp. NK8237]
MIIQSLVSGLAIGGIYALLAVAFLLTYRVAGVLNFAQAEFVMLGAFVASSLAAYSGIPLLAAALLGIGASALVGVGMEQVTYRPLRNKSHASMIISTVAVGIVLHQAAHLIWGPDPRTLDSLVPNVSIDLFGARISSVSLFLIAISLVLIVGLNLLLSKTRLGRQMQATAVDADTAQLMGIRTTRIVIIAFVISTALAGAAGILVAPIFSVAINVGMLIALKAFAACVIGGFGNLSGAAIAAFGLGIVENFAGAFIGSDSKDLIAFALMIGFLLIRPQGIFGSKVGEKL